MNLYETSQKYAELKAMLDSQDSILLNDYTQKPDDTFYNEVFEKINFDLEELANDMAIDIKNLQAFVTAMKEERKELERRIQVKQNRVNSLKRYLSNAMILADKKKLETPQNLLSFRKSQQVVISDEEKFMEKYPQFTRSEVTHEVQKSLVKKEMKSGAKFDFAILEEKQNLQIK